MGETRPPTLRIRDIMDMDVGMVIILIGWGLKLPGNPAETSVVVGLMVLHYSAGIFILIIESMIGPGLLQKKFFFCERGGP